MKRYIVGMSGATGAVLAYKLTRELLEKGHQVELVASKPAMRTSAWELGVEFGNPQKIRDSFPHSLRERLIIHPIQDIGATIASGSYQTDAMIIVPCSMATVAAIAVGLGDNLLRRAADVTLKERRPLVLVFRESPLSEIHLENLLKLSRLGVHVVPPIPAWYTRPQSLGEVEDQIVGRVLASLGISSKLHAEWDGVDHEKQTTHHQHVN